MNADQTHPRPSLWRLLPASLGLLVVWLWAPRTVSPLPPGTVQPASAQELAALPASTYFLLAGVIRVNAGADGTATDGASAPQAASRASANADAAGAVWQGRAVYVQRKRIDHGGGGTSRHQTVDVVAQHRPALQFIWPGGRIGVAADSYGLDHAPRIEPAWNDAWDRSSRGLRDGEAALALGYVDQRRHRIDALMAAPLSAVHDDIRNERRKRDYLLLAARIIATAILLSWLSPLWPGGWRGSRRGA